MSSETRRYEPSTPLPPLRQDLSGQQLPDGSIVLYDESGYAERSVTLQAEAVDHLLLFDGEQTPNDLARLGAAVGRPVALEALLDLVEMLDREFFLDSEGFALRKEERDRAYNRLTTRPAAFAGSSYPADPERLRETLDSYLENRGSLENHESPIAIFSPHIDPRVGGDAYGPAWNALRNSDADTFVIFGIPHRMSYDRFMISRMDFDTPLGPLPTDREFIEKLRSGLSYDLTEDEVAHRDEHSIEFQAIFLRHLFPDRDIRIVPILAGSLWDYVESGRGGAATDDRLSEFYDLLGTTAAELGRRVCYIAGVDFCHIGRKFGDEFDAAGRLAEIREHDLRLIAEATRPDADGVIRALAASRNRYRVCGTAAMYATLRAARPARGSLLCYDQWDESDTSSAVSFASLAFYE